MDKDSKKDIGYATAKAVIGSIPLVGAAASELLQLIVTPPIEKRRTEWMNDIGDRLQNLEETKSIDLETLRNNDVFIDVIIKTTQEALKTNETEKLEYFKNAIINTATEEKPDLSEIQTFLNLIATFTIWHIRILKLFDEPSDWFDKREITIPKFMGANLSSILEIGYPELKEKKEFYNLVWTDLERAGLHNTSGLKATMSGSGLLVSRTTNWGKQFLNFIEK